MELSQRRKRKRKPTQTPRFGVDSVAYEIALIRASYELQRELEKSEKKDK